MITSKDYKTCECEGICNCEPSAEIFSLHRLVELMKYQMQNRLREKMYEGFSGWDNPEMREELMNRIKEKIQKEELSDQDFIDIANFCAFLWNLEHK